jgi:hypothetical protein
MYNSHGGILLCSKNTHKTQFLHSADCKWRLVERMVASLRPEGGTVNWNFRYLWWFLIFAHFVHISLESHKRKFAFKKKVMKEDLKEIKNIYNHACQINKSCTTMTSLMFIIVEVQRRYWSRIITSTSGPKIGIGFYCKQLYCSSIWFGEKYI